MAFSSIIFLSYFLPVFLFIYYLVPKGYKNAVILLGSIFFYAWGAPRFIFVILGTTMADFFLVQQMSRSEGYRRRVFLSLSLCINLGLLFYSKYSNFFVDNFNRFLGLFGVEHFEWAEVILPIGISFFTFESLTYVIDVYRRKHAPLRNFWDYQLYIILFPKLIAGPIIQYHDFANQIYDHTFHENAENRLRGFYRFIIGLSKKVLIANVMAEGTAAIFSSNYGELSAGTAWLGALSYALQIYFDFAGYSDMAIGLCLMMGFRIPENFNNPYTASSITDFWRRWHMTLGNWMKNYVYIPLGGNKVKNMRLYVNLGTVFILSGIWHGAAWGFVIWGAYHGFFLIIERLFLGKLLTRLKGWAFIYTFFVVMIGWVLFKIEYLRPSLQYFKAMFSLRNNSLTWQPDTKYMAVLLLGLIFSFFTLTGIGRRIHDNVYTGSYTLRAHYLATFAAIMLCIICLGSISVATFNPFIYFRF